MKNIKEKALQNRWNILLSCGILLLIVAILFGLYSYSHEEEAEQVLPEDYAEYETGTVVQILTDTCEIKPNTEDSYAGEQKLLVEITSGQYAGQTMLVDNFVGPTYGNRAEVGESIVMVVNTYGDGTHTATGHEYNRTPSVLIILGLFVLITILVGGKTGAKSILGLILTVAMLLTVFLPLLLKGWEPVPTAFLLCSLVAVACFIILGGCSKKIAGACIGTVAGMALAMLFGILAQKLLQLDGLRSENAEALLQLRRDGLDVRIRGLLVAGVIISALGAVMDVAMSISSALGELKAVNPQMKAKELWKSGMNIGRDMVGTMTNTLILAILGSSTVLILYLYSLDLSWHQLMSSSYIAIEVISSVSSAVGVILAVPLTTAAAALLYGGMPKVMKK